MRTRWAVLSLVAGVALMLAACTTAAPVSRQTPTPPASAAPSAPAPISTPAAGPVGVTLSAADLTTLTGMYINYRNEPGNAGEVFAPGSVSVLRSGAVQVPGGDQIAYVVFVPSPSATYQNQVDMQEGAGEAVYMRFSPDSPWLLRGLLTLQPPCTAMMQLGVPAAVAAMFVSCTS